MFKGNQILFTFIFFMKIWGLNLFLKGSVCVIVLWKSFKNELILLWFHGIDDKI